MPVDLLRDGLLRVRDETAPPVRDALQEWMEEADERGLDIPAAPATPTAAGRCARCNDREATSVCVHCAGSVCATDFWVMFGLCRACLTEDEVRQARTRPAPRPDLGIKWVDD